MTKGLARTIGRGAPQVAPIIKKTIEINETMSFTGVTSNAIDQTAVIAGLPQGNILLLGAVAYLTLTGPTSGDLADDFQGDYGIGTTPADDNTISAGDVNIIDSTAIAAATSEVSPTTRGVIANTSGVVDALILDNTDGSLEINLNVLLDADEVTNAVAVDIVATGVLHIAYIVLGDD